MRIAVLLGAFSIGNRPLDMSALWTSDRGLTGTELAFVRVSEELRKLGHEVETRCSPTPEHIALAADSDAVINFNEPNLFIGINGPVRVLYMMLNDFSFVQTGFDEWTDLYVGVCQQHADYVAANSNTPRGKWSVVPLGCDPYLYTDGKQVPGRVIWCSSADRGLHWLLQEWPAIKAAVPYASLRVFYHFNYDHVIGVERGSISPQRGPYHHHIQEMAQRVRYIKHAMGALRHLDVEHVGSVSRNRMVEEWNEAAVFGFSADTVSFSEGFSVSTLEAHASYTTPVITDADCLGGIYKDSGAVVIEGPIKGALPQFRHATIQSLERPTSHLACRAFAERHTWAATAKQLETLILERK